MGNKDYYNTLIGSNTKQLSNAKQSITKISNNANTFTSLTQNFIDQQNGINMQLESTINMFKSGNAETEKYYNEYESITTAVTVGLYVLFGFIILISVLIITVSCLTYCC